MIGSEIRWGNLLEVNMEVQGVDCVYERQMELIQGRVRQWTASDSGARQLLKYLVNSREIHKTLRQV
jgi:hypothetical protein